MKMKDTVVALLIMGLYGLTICAVRNHIYVNHLLSWHEAQQYCRQRYHDLSTVASIEEIKSLPTPLPSSCPNNTDYYRACLISRWTGIYMDNDNETRWSGEEHEQFCTAVFPKSGHAGTCGMVLNVLYQCFPVPCAWNLSFYCMIKFDVILVEQKMAWQEALEYCRAKYIDLVSLTSDFWMKEAIDVSWEAETAHVWTGLRFLNGHWFWTTQFALKYQAWDSDSESQCPASNLRCGALTQSKGIWETRDCDEKLNFLCYRLSERTPYQL